MSPSPLWRRHISWTGHPSPRRVQAVTVIAKLKFKSGVSPAKRAESPGMQRMFSQILQRFGAAEVDDRLDIVRVPFGRAPNLDRKRESVSATPPQVVQRGGVLIHLA